MIPYVPLQQHRHRAMCDCKFFTAQSADQQNQGNPSLIWYTNLTWDIINVWPLHATSKSPKVEATLVSYLPKNIEFDLETYYMYK